MMRDDEEAKVTELRRQFSPLLSDKYDTDFNLLRWVRSEGGNMDVVCPRLRRHLVLRRLFRLDQITQELKDNDLICSYYPLSYVGPCGRDNNLLVIDQLGSVDISGLLKCVSTISYIKQRFKFLEQLYEKMNDMERATGIQSGVVYVVDMEGLTLEPALIRMTNIYRMSWSVFGDNYVDWMRNCLIINTPWFFSKVWSIFCIALPQLTRMKIRLLGSSWRKEILNYVDADFLPRYWGGNMIDENGDERCSSRVRYPLTEKIPKSLYWKSQIPADYFAGYETLHVPAGTTIHLAYEVKEMGVTIVWKTYSNEDYGFVLFYSKEAECVPSDHMEVCFPYFDHPGKIAPSEESVKATATGIYYFCFTNKAWFQSAAVLHRIDFVNDDGPSPVVVQVT